jgi:ArsR family transcriptional regulator, virulence genes transcriptional regulator
MDVKRFDIAAGKASEFVKSLANPTRLRILCVLAARECSVTVLTEAVGAPMPTISRHLSLLRKDHIVKKRRMRQTIFYSLSDSRIARIVEILGETFCKVETPLLQSACVPQGERLYDPETAD